MKNLLFVFLIALCAAIGPFALFGCAPVQTSVPQYADNVSFAVAYTHDDVTGQTSAPMRDEVMSALNMVLIERNLKVEQIAFEGIKDQLGAIRDTDRRLNALRASAKGSQFILLTEVSTEFYAPLSGRYRWDVNVHMSIYDIAARKSFEDKFSVPAVLMYSHEKGEDAIESVQSELQKHLGGLIDTFMKGRAANAAAPEQPLALRMRDIPEDLPPAAATSAPEAQKPETKVVEAAPVGGASPGEAIYFIMIDRFFNAQNLSEDLDPMDPAGWHGGDLAGIEQKLPWLQGLGITRIWLSPVFSAAHEKFFGNGAFHGYWTYDLNEIDSHFGSEEDLRHLAAEARRYDISLILDFVVNHVGYGSPLVEQKPDWFHPALTIEDWNDPVQLTQRQVHGLPDLDQSNPEVAKYLKTAAKKWLSIPNISGLRLDAVKHVDLNFWADFNDTMNSVRPNLILMGEYFDGDPKKVDEVQKAGHFSQMFDFPLAFALRDVFCENKSLVALAGIITNDRLYTSPNDMVTFLDNHDMPRFISLCHNDTEAMGRALRVMLAWRGIPSIYYGTEGPLAGDKEPDNRADMNFDSAYFYPLIQSALRLRAQYPVFAKGATATLVYEPGLAVFAREFNKQQALIVVSQKLSAKQNFHLPPGIWKDAETGRQYQNVLIAKPNYVQLLIRDDAPESIIKHGKRSVTFNLPQNGEKYSIVGSAPELGNWNPAKAPSGTGSITIELPLQTVVAYKPVKIDAGGKVTWAEGDNRELFTDDQSVVDVKW